MKSVLYFIQLIYSTGFNLLYRILPSYLSTYVASAFQIGFVHTAYSVTRLLNVPCGMLSDKMGKRRTLFFTFFFLPFIALAFTVSRSLWHFTSMFILIGLLANFYYSSLNALVTIFFKRKVESLFRLEAMYQLGFVIGPIVGGFLTLQYGIEAAFYTWALLGVGGLVLSSLIFKEKELATAKKKYRGLWAGLKVHKLAFLVFLIAGGIFTGFLDSVRDLGIPLYGTSLGMSIYEVGLLFGISSIVSFVGFFLLGKKLEKVKREPSLIITLLLMTVPFFLFALFQDILSLAVLAGVFTLGRAGGLNIARAFVSDNISVGARASGIALIDTMYYVGRVTGPLYAGALIDLVSIPFLFFTGGVIPLAGVALVAVYWAVRK